MTEKKTKKKPTAAEKTAPKKEELSLPEFDVRKTYKIEATGGNIHLKEGQIYEVTGELAKILVSRGTAKLV
jgi:hypothetical protein